MIVDSCLPDGLYHLSFFLYHLTRELRNDSYLPDGLYHLSFFLYHLIT